MGETVFFQESAHQMVINTKWFPDNIHRRSILTDQVIFRNIFINKYVLNNNEKKQTMNLKKARSNWEVQRN